MGARRLIPNAHSHLGQLRFSSKPCHTSIWAERRKEKGAHRNRVKAHRAYIFLHGLAARSVAPRASLINCFFVFGMLSVGLRDLGAQE